jgi:hypothetical protein
VEIRKKQGYENKEGERENEWGKKEHTMEGMQEGRE